MMTYQIKMYPHFAILPLLASICIAAPSAAATKYSTLLANSVIDRHTPLGQDYNGKPVHSYEHGVLERSFEMLFNLTGDTKYNSYLKAGIDNTMDATGKFLAYNATLYSLDDIRLGQSILYLYESTGEEKYKIAADTLRKQINDQPRNYEGGFWHRSTYPNQMWLDGLYMGLPFYAQHTSLFNPTNTTAWTDILHQFILIESHCRNLTTQLLVHGYDASHTAIWASPITGASPHVWIRALGWYVMAIIDVLDYFPTSHPGYSLLEGYFISAMKGIRNSWDENEKGWWLVMDLPAKEGNWIESSGAAMFVYAGLKGVRKGLLGKEFGGEVGDWYKGTMERFVQIQTNGTADWRGTVQVGSLNKDASFEYYVSIPERINDLKGVGPAIMASVEYEMRK